MRKRYIWLLLALGLILFFVLLSHLSWREVERVILHGDRRYLAMYVGVSALILVLHAVRWQIILRAKGFVVPFHNVLSYQWAAFAVSFVTPGPKVGGEAMRAGLLSRHTVHGKKIRFSRSLSTVLIDRAVELQTFATLFFVGVVWMAFVPAVPQNVKLILGITGSVFFLFMLFFAANMVNGKPLIVRIMKRFHLSVKLRRDMWHFEQAITSFYKKDRAEFILTHLLTALAWLLSLVEYKYLLLLLGINIPVYGVFIIYSFVGIAYIIPIPLALGSLEGSQAAAFALLSLDPAIGITLALITRVRDIVFTLIGFTVLTYYGIAPRKLPESVRTAGNIRR